MTPVLKGIVSLDSFASLIGKDDLLSRQRFRLFRKATLISVIAFLAFTIQVFVVAAGNTVLIASMSALFILCIVNYFTLNAHRRLPLASAILLALWFMMVHVDTYYSGGIRNSANVYFAVLILTAYLLLGRTGGKIMAIFSVLHMVYFYIVGRQTNWISYDLVGTDPALVDLYFFLSTTAALLALTFQSIYIHETSKEFISNIEAEKTVLEKSGETLEEKNKELERKNIELEEFAYIASHDLQEPLKTSAGLAQLMRRQYQGKLDEKADQYLSFIVDSAVRMKKLIQDLLDYSRIGHQGKLAVINCNELVEELRADLSELIAEMNAVIVYQTLPTIKGYTTEIKLLFLNLVVNAIKFSKPGIRPEVIISGWAENAGWHFKVSDNGIGIRPEFFEKIFLIFHRLNSNSDARGSGIGLAHCKKIVKLHNANIWVESSPGEGTTFHFTIRDIS